MVSLSYADDEHGEFRAVQSFHKAVYGDAVTYVRPACEGVGHHGFFKPWSEARWQDTLKYVAPAGPGGDP